MRPVLPQRPDDHQQLVRVSEAHVGPTLQCPQVSDRNAEWDARQYNADVQICQVHPGNQEIPQTGCPVPVRENQEKCEHGDWQECGFCVESHWL